MQQNTHYKTMPYPTKPGGTSYTQQQTQAQQQMTPLQYFTQNNPVQQKPTYQFGNPTMVNPGGPTYGPMPGEPGSPGFEITGPGQNWFPDVPTQPGSTQPPPPQTAMVPGQSPYSQYGQNPLMVPPPNYDNGPNQNQWQRDTWNPARLNEYGGQRIAGANPDQADYNSVQGYADSAHQNAMRYLQPQIDQQNRRFQQELINKGIDPNSPQGQEAAAQLGRQQADARNAAAFNALGFGQGIQQQMADQMYQKSSLAGDMQKSYWDAQLGGQRLGIDKYSTDKNFALGMNQNRTQQYMADLQQQVQMGQLDLQQAQELARQWEWQEQFKYDAWRGNNELAIIEDAFNRQTLGGQPPPTTPISPTPTGTVRTDQNRTYF